MLRGLKKEGHTVDRGYAENISQLSPISSYDAIYTSVRDPIARNISYFFEMQGNRLLQENTRLDCTKEEFLAEDQNYSLDWFDNVFFPATGVDVYKYDFPASGVLLIGKICVLRMEQMKFEHRADTRLTRPYGALYREFVDWVKFDDEYIDEMYSSKYAMHFFSPKEIEELWERWSDDS